MNEESTTKSPILPPVAQSSQSSAPHQVVTGPQQAPVQQPLDNTYSGAQSMTADDLDLIERVWVEKAKQIINQTTGDPYKQSKQLNTMKVDYIKKRYNKEIKPSE